MCLFCYFGEEISQGGAIVDRWSVGQEHIDEAAETVIYQSFERIEHAVVATEAADIDLLKSTVGDKFCQCRTILGVGKDAVFLGGNVVALGEEVNFAALSGIDDGLKEGGTHCVLHTVHRPWTLGAIAGKRRVIVRVPIESGGYCAVFIGILGYIVSEFVHSFGSAGYCQAAIDKVVLTIDK